MVKIQFLQKRPHCRKRLEFAKRDIIKKNFKDWKVITQHYVIFHFLLNMFDEGFVLDLFVETSLIGLFIFKFSSEGGQKKTITDQKEND